MRGLADLLKRRTGAATEAAEQVDDRGGERGAERGTEAATPPVRPVRPARSPARSGQRNAERGRDRSGLDSVRLLYGDAAADTDSHAKDGPALPKRVARRAAANDLPTIDDFDPDRDRLVVMFEGDPGSADISVRTRRDSAGPFLVVRVDGADMARIPWPAANGRPLTGADIALVGA